MADPVWQDTVTPLNAANMNKLQTRDEKGAPSGYAPLGADSKVPAANLPPAPNLALYQPVAQKDQPSGYVGLDASSSAILAGGISAGQDIFANLGTPQQVGFTFAAGGQPAVVFGSARDTSLYRNAATSLRTNAQVWVDQAVYVNMALPAAQQVFVGQLGGSPGAAGITLGGDTNLYRSAAGSLKTDNALLVGGAVYLGGGTDTSLFRVAGNIVGTIGSFQSQGALSGWGFNTLASGDTQPRSYLRNDGVLFFGPGGTTPLDTRLMRTGVGTLSAPDGSFTAGGLVTTSHLWIDQSQNGYVINFGPSSDAQLWRPGAGSLKTNANFFAQGLIRAAQGQNAEVGLGATGPSGQAGIYWGIAADCTVYRYGANTLSTPGNLRIEGAAANGGSTSGLLITFGIYGARWVDVGPPDSGGSGYRAVIVGN